MLSSKENSTALKFEDMAKQIEKRDILLNVINNDFQLSHFFEIPDQISNVEINKRYIDPPRSRAYFG